MGSLCQGGAGQFSFAFALSRYSATERPGNLIRGQIMNQAVPEKGGGWGGGGGVWNISTMLFGWALSIFCCRCSKCFQSDSIARSQSFDFTNFQFFRAGQFPHLLAVK